MSDGPFFPPERYESEHFVLRRYEPGDGALLAEATNASYEHLQPFMPWAVPHQSDAEAEVTVRRFAANYLLNENFVLAIVAPDGSRLLGGTGYHPKGSESILETRSAEIGMWIRADEAGKGLGTAVLRALIEWGFTAWPWERLFWRCFAHNEASARTALSAGLIAEGRQRGSHRNDDGTRVDDLLFSLLKTEWQGKAALLGF